MLFSSWLVAGVLLWLGAAAYQDWKRQEVALCLTIPPLLLVTGYRILVPVEGEIVPGGLTVGLALLTLLLSDRWFLFIGSGSVALVAAWFSGPLTLLLVGCWVIATGFFKVGLWGGADAKVFLTLVTLWPAPLLVGTLLSAWVLGNGVTLWQRYGWNSPRVLASTARDLLQRVPATEQQLTYLATLPWLSLGACSYLMLHLGGLG